MSVPSTTTGAPAGSPSTAVAPAAVLRTGAVAAVIALLANLLVLVIGKLAGADMVVEQSGGATQTVGVPHVLVSTVVGITAGTLLLLALRNRGRRAWMTVATVGLVVGIVTVAAPLATRAETSTQLTLAAMHVVAGLVWFLLVRRGARTLLGR